MKEWRKEIKASHQDFKAYWANLSSWEKNQCLEMILRDFTADAMASDPSSKFYGTLPTSAAYMANIRFHKAVFRFTEDPSDENLHLMRLSFFFLPMNWEDKIAFRKHNDGKTRLHWLRLCMSMISKREDYETLAAAGGEHLFGKGGPNDPWPDYRMLAKFMNGLMGCLDINRRETKALIAGAGVPLLFYQDACRHLDEPNRPDAAEVSSNKIGKNYSI